VVRPPEGVSGAGCGCNEPKELGPFNAVAGQDGLVLDALKLHFVEEVGEPVVELPWTAILYRVPLSIKASVAQR